MNLPAHAISLGTVAGPLPVVGAAVHATLPLTAQGRYLLADWTAAAPGQLYLVLDQVRGTHDATVLQVYLNLPPGEPPAAAPQQRVDSVALFGLRRASVPDSAGPGPGLSLLLDVTRLAAGLEAQAPSALRVSLVPNRPLPPTSDLVVGQIGLYLLPPS